MGASFMITGVIAFLGLIAYSIHQKITSKKESKNIRAAKERANKKAAARSFADTEPFVESKFEYSVRNTQAEVNDFGFADLTAQEHQIISRIFDDSLAPKLNLMPAYLVCGQQVDSIK